MGWTGHFDRGRYVAEKMKGWTCESGAVVTVRKHHACGEQDWFILDVTEPDGATKAVITVAVWDGTMVKCIDEAAGPYYYGCPIEWLDEVPEPEHDPGFDWRGRLHYGDGGSMAITFIGRRGNWEIRDFHGYFQSREIYESGRRGAWRFNVTGFDVMGQPGTCNVLMADEKTETVCKINSRGILTVMGRRYDSHHWDH